MLHLLTASIYDMFNARYHNPNRFLNESSHLITCINCSPNTSLDLVDDLEIIYPGKSVYLQKIVENLNPLFDKFHYCYFAHVLFKNPVSQMCHQVSTQYLHRHDVLSWNSRHIHIHFCLFCWQWTLLMDLFLIILKKMDLYKL